MSNVYPPLLSQRDVVTGLVSNVDYVFNDNGTVNWRKMVKPEYLAVNEDNYIRRNEQVPESIEGVADFDLIILLAGLKELAKLRGYISLDSKPVVACPEYVCVECKIQWLPHRDTGGLIITSTGIAMATLKNTEGFTKAYLAEMAENRAFARCIRSFLGINIVSREEIGSESLAEEAPKTNAADPAVQLENLMIQKNVTFETIKQKVMESKFKGAENWQSIKDIPKYKIMSLIKKISSL
jgi:hypothetical protein